MPAVLLTGASPFAASDAKKNIGYLIVGVLVVIFAMFLIWQLAIKDDNDSFSPSCCSCMSHGCGPLTAAQCGQFNQFSDAYNPELALDSGNCLNMPICCNGKMGPRALQTLKALRLINN